jgi:MEMO1 family protein
MPIAPLRPLEAFPIEKDGKPILAIRDPLGVVPDVLAVAPEVFFVASHFDGERDAEGVAAAVGEALSVRVSAEVVERIAHLFGERCLLDDERFRKLEREQREAFSRSASRAAAHAGAAYPSDPDELRHRVGGILAEAWDQPRFEGRVVGLVAPHIDLERGQSTYARTYAAIRDIGKVDRIVILGTSHAPTGSLLVPTRKSYETPLGIVPTDEEAVDRVASALGEPAFVDEFVHRGEHSIEFQALFLRLTHPKASIVPLLCGSLRTVVPDGSDPAGCPEVELAVRVIRELATPRSGKRTLILAAADLAHIGPRFGGPALSVEGLETTEREDRASLDLATERDAAGWYRSVTEGGDPRNVCGLTPIYLLLRALESGRGHLLSYRRCESPDQCVTIAGMAFVDGDGLPESAETT